MMRIKLKILLIALIVSHFLALMGDKKSDNLMDVAFKTLKKEVSKAKVESAVNKGFWNDDKSAVVISVFRKKTSINYVFIIKEGGTISPVDISKVEGGNLGKIGWARNKYEKVETEPVNWIKIKDRLLQINMRTRAWKDGQRYTVYEKLILDRKGKVYWR